MKQKKVVVWVMLLTALFVGWASIAAAFSYSGTTYNYIGMPPLRGTVPGDTYVAKAGVITNNTSSSQQVTVNLYYGDFNGQYQYSPNYGVNWFDIAQGATTWTPNVLGNSSIWLRVVLRDSQSNIYHILSSTPHGKADQTLGDAYYYAFSPNAYYYSNFSTREVGITGYVAVVKGDMLQSSCVTCHGNQQTMTGLGYPEFYFDPNRVRAETGMPWAQCVDCHLGNPEDNTVDGAHEGVAGLLLMKGQYRDTLKRKDVTGDDYEKVRSLASIRASNSDDPRTTLRVQSPFHMLLWHDQSLETAAWDPSISLRTCGRCHAGEVAEFNTTEMGTVLTMSQYIPWIIPADTGVLGEHLKVAPQSCGLWTEATTKPNNDAFTDFNRQLYNDTSTIITPQYEDPRYPETSADPLTKLQSLANQKNCNKCHPGCLDCHFTPFAENVPARNGGVKLAGTHTISRRPPIMSCAGGGRGQFCHGGPIDRRRGDGFIKGSFAHVVPTDLQSPETVDYLATPDIHYNGDGNTPNATCVDCHGPLPGGTGGGVMGDMNRNPEPERCAVCHPDEVAAYSTGNHSNLTCGACHTAKVVGYAFNFWAPGARFGITPNPMDRHALYAVNAMSPVLLTDEDGKWAPYHVVPHISTHIDPAVLNVEDVLSPSILWRNQPDIDIIRQHPSKDGVAVTGSYNGADYGRDEGQVMTWLNIDKMAHSITAKTSAIPPRTCNDCHTPDGTQRINISFAWNSNPALVYEGLFKGTFDIVANGSGLHVENLVGLQQDDTPSNALVPMMGKWSVPGSYIIPAINGAATGHPAAPAP